MSSLFDWFPRKCRKCAKWFIPAKGFLGFCQLCGVKQAYEDGFLDPASPGMAPRSRALIENLAERGFLDAGKHAERREATKSNMMSSSISHLEPDLQQLVLLISKIISDRSANNQFVLGDREVNEIHRIRKKVNSDHDYQEVIGIKRELGEALVTYIRAADLPQVERERLMTLADHCLKTGGSNVDSPSESWRHELTVFLRDILLPVSSRFGIRSPYDSNHFRR